MWTSVIIRMTCQLHRIWGKGHYIIMTSSREWGSQSPPGISLLCIYCIYTNPILSQPPHLLWQWSLRMINGEHHKTCTNIYTWQYIYHQVIFSHGNTCSLWWEQTWLAVWSNVLWYPEFHGHQVPLGDARQGRMELVEDHGGLWLHCTGKEGGRGGRGIMKVFEVMCFCFMYIITWHTFNFIQQ